MMDDGDEDAEITLALQAAPVMDDGDEDAEITLALQAASHRASQASQVQASQIQVRRAASDQADQEVVVRSGGGWRYSLPTLLQALLFSHYIRCAADFARAVVFAVAFALGAKAGQTGHQ